MIFPPYYLYIYFICETTEIPGISIIGQKQYSKNESFPRGELNGQ